MVDWLGKDGRRFAAVAVVTPRRDSSGEVTGFLLTSRSTAGEIAVVARNEKLRALWNSHTMRW